MIGTSETSTAVGVHSSPCYRYVFLGVNLRTSHIDSDSIIGTSTQQ
jgi:hypothetical protein